MHKYLVQHYILSNFHATCGLQYRGYIDLQDSKFCIFQIIAGKHNLTMLPEFGKQEGSESFGHRYFGNIIYATKRFENVSFVYEVNYMLINFVTITNLPSAASGLTTFVTPFDADTWLCLRLSVGSVAVFLSWFTWQGSRQQDFHWRMHIVTMVEKIITVASILLGQVGDSSVKAYRVGKVVLVLLTLWLFGNILLM